MKSLVYQLLFVILIYVKWVYNFPTGAPDYACGTMTPNHTAVIPQQCSTKYKIQSDKSQYSTTDTVRITVSGSTSGDIFRGVLLTAKTETGGQITGSWSVVSSTIKTLACDGTANTGVTHNSRSDKTSVEAIWTPPSTVSSEKTIIRATVVTQYTLIHVNCFNITLTNRQINQSTNGTATTVAGTNMSTSTTVVATTTTPQSSTTGVDISWTYTNDVTTVKMKINNLKTSQWLALGLSLDESMGEDHVFVCKRLANDTVTVLRCINPGSYTPPQVISTGHGGTFTPTSGRLDNGATYCEFTLSNFGSSKRRERALSDLSPSISYHPLIATGNLDSSNAITKHTSRTPLSKTVQLNRQETITSDLDSNDSPQTSLMKAHGIIMIFAWILFASTGILVARHFKPLWPEKKVCGKVIWFTVHRTIMTSVAVLIIIAFILILVYEKGRWISKDEQLKFAHSIIGIIVISFAIIQPIMALFRCKPDAENRFIFNYAHRTVGFSAFILSIVAIFLAMFFDDFTFQDNKQWGIILAWVCWVPVIFFIFWFIEFYFRRNESDKEHADSYDLGNTSPKNEEIQPRNNEQQNRIKLIFLSIHILVAFGLSLALAILVGLQ